jgi:hypothetical protein
LIDTYEEDYEDMVEIDGHSIPYYNIYDYGYIHIACKDPQIKRTAKEYESRWYVLRMHFNMPDFNTIQQGMKFLYYLTKTIFKRDDFRVNSFGIDGGYYYSKYEDEINVHSDDAESFNDYNSFYKHTLNEYDRDCVLGCLFAKNQKTTYGNGH